MQAIAVRAASNKPAEAASGGVDPGLVVRLLGQWRFVVSMGLDALGFVAQLVALHRLPLFAVQAFVASNLAVTAVVASRVIRVTLSWREWAAVLGVVAGVGLLGSSAGAEGAAQVGAMFKLALIVAIAGLSVVAWGGFFIAVASAVMLARFGEAHQTEDVAMADAAARRQANAGPAAAGLLSWWPVDLQFSMPYWAPPYRTPREPHSGRIITSSTAGANQTSLRHRRRRLQPRQGTDRIQPRPPAETARPAGRDAEARPLPQRRPRHHEPLPAR